MNNLHNFGEFKAVIRGVLVATTYSLTVDELWESIAYVLGEEEALNLTKHFGFHTPFDLFMSIPHVVQIECPENRNSAAVTLVSSEQIMHVNQLVLKDIIRANVPKHPNAVKHFLIPYRVQCAFIRIFVELYPEGMKIDDFISNVLSMDIFKPFINHVVELIFYLSHIFETSNLEVIYLQPTIVNRLREIKEKDKFSASYISSIDQNSLEDKNLKQELDYGLEYPLYNILQNQLKNNIEQLLNDETVGWLSETEICSLFKKKFGFKLTQYRQWGFKKLSDMFLKLPEICGVCFIDNYTKIISIKKDDYFRDMNSMTDSEKKEIDYELPSIDGLDISEKTFDSELLNILKNDPKYQASLNDCFMSGEIQHFKLQINESYDVHVCSVNISDITIVCQSFDKSDELMNLLVIMNTFYSANQSKFACSSTTILVNQTYAFCLDELWFRGIVINNNANLIEIFNIDNGIVSKVNHDDIRILHKQFSQLPAQTLTCHLHGIKSMDEYQLLKILDKKCTVNIIAIDSQNKYVCVLIKLMGSKLNEYLNDEWSKTGNAESYSFDKKYFKSDIGEICSSNEK